MAEHGKCGRTEKLNIKIRANKGPLAGHELWQSEQLLNSNVDLIAEIAAAFDFYEVG
jgi:hypothetical protein